MTDLDVVARCQAGDADAWGEFFNACQDRVFKLALLVTRSRQDAQDVTQETFIRLIKTIHSYDASKGSFETWLYAIVVNLGRDHLRRRNRLPLPWDMMARGDRLPAAPADQPETISLAREWQRDIWEAVNRLNDKQRIAVVLHYYLDLSCEQIAEVLGCPSGTVYSRLHYARLALEKELSRPEQGLALEPFSVKSL
ncbi:MAG: RNA polymerase sigma factor [Chloroflexi bacterium]|nr:RNA polymerase sigma factor [Chloroflexota bacterium]